MTGGSFKDSFEIRARVFIVVTASKMMNDLSLAVRQLRTQLPSATGNLVRRRGAAVVLRAPSDPAHPFGPRAAGGISIIFPLQKC